MVFLKKMTTVLKKSSSSSRPKDSSIQVADTNCECLVCVNRPVSPKLRNLNTEYLENKGNDSENLIYSLIMLIIEGRTIRTSQIESIHDNLIIDKLLRKAINLNQIEGKNSSALKYSTPVSKSSIFKSCNKPEHVCLNDFNYQCRLASILRNKIEKCIQDHLKLETTNLEIRNDESKQLNQNFSDASFHLNKFQNQKDLHNNQLSESVLSYSVPIEFNNIRDDKIHNPEYSLENIDFNIQKFNGHLKVQPFKQINNHLICSKFVLDVYLLPDCCFKELLSKKGYTLLDSTNAEFELLESWTISMITNHNNERNKSKILTLKELFQAIRSYLHFSQISSWINQSNGEHPRNIAYWLECSSEKANYSESKLIIDEDTSFSNLNINEDEHKNFEFQTFPSLNLLFSNNKLDNSNTTPLLRNSNQSQKSNLTQLKVSLFSVKRSDTKRQPKICCIKHNTDVIEKNLFTNNNPHVTIYQTCSNFNKENVTEPILINCNLKQVARNLDANIQNLNRNMNNQSHFYLPHWSTLMTSPQTIKTTMNYTSDIKQHGKFLVCSDNSPPLNLTPDLTQNRSIAQNLLIPQHLKLSPILLQGQVSDITNNNDKINDAGNIFNSPITTPTSFPDSKLSFHVDTENENLHNIEAKIDNNFPISMSPKVLVSDLCNFAQSQLKIHSIATKSNLTNNSADTMNFYTAVKSSTNKRKFINEIDSATHSDLENKSGMEQACDNHNIQVISTKITGDLHSGTLATSVTIGSSIDYESTQKSRPLNQHLNHTNVNNYNLNIIKNKYDKDDDKNNNYKPVISLNNNNKYIDKNANFRPVILNNNISNHVDNENDKYSNSNEFYDLTCDVNNNNFELDEKCYSNYCLNDNRTRKLHQHLNVYVKNSHLPLSSSPAPLRKSGSSLFDFDNSLKNPRSIKNALSSKLLTNNIKAKNDGIKNESDTTLLLIKNQELIEDNSSDKYNDNDDNKADPKIQKMRQKNSLKRPKSFKSFNMQLSFSNSALCLMPITPNCLLGSFEESLLNGRMNPVGIVDGFYAEIGASGSFFPEHITIPVQAAFYQVCEDVAASPYLGIINLANVSKRGYKVPNKGTIQVTLFNPNKTVVKMFVVMYDLSDMPPSHRTFLRQRTMYVPLMTNIGSNGSFSSSNSSSITNNIKPVKKFHTQNYIGNSTLEDDEDSIKLKSYLRYLIHLRFATSKSGKMYLHTNIKLIFARNKCEIDPRLAKYEYKTFTESPRNPRYSPKK